MGYLVCDKCGGFYELQSGESPEDFDEKCECGGSLKYFKSPKKHPNNLKSFLKSFDITRNQNNSKISFGPLISIIIGVFIGLITYYPIVQMIDIGWIIGIIWLPFVAGVVSSYLAERKKDILKISVISGALSRIFQGSFSTISVLMWYVSTGHSLVLGIIYSLIAIGTGATLGAIIGLIGGYIVKYVKRT